MKKPGQRNILSVFVITLVLTFVGGTYLTVNSLAQQKTPLPVRNGYVNDFAGVIDEKVRQRLEVMLDNLKQRSGIELDIATVETTGTKDIFDFSRELASEWNRGARTSSKKSLLLVVAVNEKAAFTQFSRSVQPDLPEGILGELGLRMRGPISSGRFSEGLNDGVSHFINALAKKIGFAAQDIDQVQVAGTTLNELPAVRPRIATAEKSPSLKTASEAKPAAATKPSAKVTKNEDPPVRTARSKYVNTPEDDADEAEDVELVLTLPLSERVSKLKEFLTDFPNSKSVPRAIELIVSTYASLGDQKLKNGDSEGGIEQLMLAIAEAPSGTTDMLFAGVIAQIPSNLYLRGEHAAAFDAARKIEAKFGSDPKRLLILTGFYLGIEDGEEAARVAARAVKLSPDLADAHRALGLGLHLSLRLEEAAAEYRRALELDPNSRKATRRSLADLNRAGGKTEAALALYREQLVAEPADRAARAGMVLSLLELGRNDEAKKELEAAMANDPQNLILLAGASYWFAAHKDVDRALEFAQKAVQLEPRYTWSQIALSRALSGQKKPLEAERAIRFAEQYGKFPTLDYELARVLASMGLYDEAAETLQRSFSFKQGQIETRLAGRVLTRADDFSELLALERRASIFQLAGAEQADESSVLKALLAFAVATQVTDRGQLDEVKAALAAKKFAAGTDEMRAYRQIYAANRLLKRGIALQTALELTEAARTAVDAALGVPGVTVAVQAEELRDMRARALAQGGTPDVPEAPRNVLGNILRGRVEDLAGLALFNQDKTVAALEHFRRAVAILPEGTPSSRNAMWHLGTALDQAGEKQEALTYYIRSYNAGEMDPVRRGVIEALYRKVNGSLDGLDDRIGSRIVATNRVTPARANENPVVVAENPAPSPQVESVSSPERIPVASPVAAPLDPAPSIPKERVPAATPTPEATPVVTPEMTPQPATPVVTPTPEATPAATPEVTPTPDAAPVSTPTPEATPTPEPSPTPTPETPAPEPTPQASPEATPQASPEASPTQPGEMRTRFATRVRVTGKVKNANGEGIANVVMVLISPRGTVLSSTTDIEGNYSFSVSPSPLSYRIIPSKEGFTFAPIDKVVVGFNEDQKAVDFVGTASP
ncbi:MAG: TPM domain-containing protein [Pyrinomonadaceae bacterium]